MGRSGSDMVTESDDIAGTLREWVARHPRAFELVEPSPHGPATLLELASGKSLTLELGALVAVEQARDAVRGGSYLRIALADGRTFALAGVGIVFAPSFVSTGDLPDCPAAACFMDFEKVFHHLTHLVDDPHEGHEGEALHTLMILLSFLDGARAIGLDVGEEERRVEAKLERLEAMGVPGL